MTEPVEHGEHAVYHPAPRTALDVSASSASRAARAAALAAQGLGWSAVASQTGYSGPMQARTAATRHVAALSLAIGGRDPRDARREYDAWLEQLRDDAHSAFELAREQGNPLAMAAATRVEIAVATRTALFLGLDSGPDVSEERVRTGIGLLGELVSLTESGSMLFNRDARAG